ncbi:hypothetical protein [Algoriphagus sediminis]|uniref:Uncharacterized protein n=1 Tax=Algoriphagus sediminis TaxID=3057113 RepID=A0ABT7YH69_9BACT|nr:hypothetical protein [Algoriphagus sediminis]MDN3205892.1 hypothetical protein [Algoriphagus sediminis]
MCSQGERFKFCSCPGKGVVPENIWKYLEKVSGSFDNGLVGELIAPYLIRTEKGTIIDELESDLNSEDAFDFTINPKDGDCLCAEFEANGLAHVFIFKYSKLNGWKTFHLEEK